MSKVNTTKNQTFLECMMKFLSDNITFSRSGKEQNSWPVFVNVIKGISFAPFKILIKV